MPDDKPARSNRVPKGTMQSLVKLVDYQPGAIVSRRIIKSQSGTVTLFAFDIAQSLSEHTAPFDALVQVIDGAAEITISGKASSLHEGDMIIIPAEAPHLVHAVGRFKMVLTLLRA
jgi:quercetin dioxygenase-like cupin family protein